MKKGISKFFENPSRIFFEGAFFFFFGVSINAAPARAFDLILEGGTNIGYVSETSLQGNQAQPGFAVGGVFEFSSNSLVSWEFGVLYAQRGFNWIFSPSQTAATFTMPNIELPLLIRFNPVSFISIGAGGYFAYGLGNVSVNGNILGVNATNSQSFTNAGFNFLDVGLTMGLMVKVPITAGIQWIFDGRGYLGLVNLNGNNPTLNTNGIYYRDIQVLSGLSFPL